MAPYHISRSITIEIVDAHASLQSMRTSFGETPVHAILREHESVFVATCSVSDFLSSKALFTAIRTSFLILSGDISLGDSVSEHQTIIPTKRNDAIYRFIEKYKKYGRQCIFLAPKVKLC